MGKEKHRDGVTIINKGQTRSATRSESWFAAVKKVHSRCSTKWVCNGGRVRSILEALNTVHDLDEALGPWREKLSNKEVSVILKEQVCWKKGLEIFEWFLKKGCYELNVIHYNIMLWILGRAREWSRVESLWNEMNARGVEPVNSTYGKLIDIYSKGGLKKEALVWLQRMLSRGLEPDEVTTGIIVQLYKRDREFT
ncbi:hypothetical protein RIF29_03292 [Crotalaria pallida]|uniref:Pentatricopeptide repeat-containing protein n=1 Tax=Crotalaria pallida TaxID=3830 RepID=A0AAN9P9R6_CROPI